MPTSRKRILGVAFLTAIIFACAGCPWDNYGPVAPSPTNLSIISSYPMVYTPGSSFLEADVNGIITYMTPQNNNDCGHNNSNARLATVDIVMQNSTDYIDFTINDSSGIAPGAISAKSYQLSYSAITSLGAPHSTAWQFIMQQSPNADDYLHIVTWRLLIGGTYD